ncbi:PQQ-binding-like beta-propeller repeat protein [Patescibacteria group bacterium]
MIQKKITLILIVFIIGVFLFNSGSVSAQLAKSPWPMFHGGPQHGGLSSYDTSRVDGTVKWAFETGDRIESSPAIGTDGTIYIGNHDNTFYAINPDGSKKWKFKVGEPEHGKKFNVQKGILASPAIAKDGIIYFSSLSDYLFALNSDGTEKWKFKLAINVDTWTSPLIGPDGTIYTGSGIRFNSDVLEKSSEGPKGKLFAINPDGTEKWSFSKKSNVATSPAIDKNGTIYLGNYVPMTELGRLYAINSDGTEKWHFDTDKLIESSPAIDKDGTIYVGTLGGKVYAINPDGTKKWVFKTGDGVSAIPAIGRDGTIYVGSWNAYFYAINPDGTEKWKYKTPDAYEAIIASAAIGSDDTIYIGSGAGIFYAFNPDGTVKWEYQSPSQDGFASSPAIGADGTVYVGGQSGKLYAFGGSSTKDDENQDETTKDVPIVQVIGIIGVLVIAFGVSIFSVLRKRKLKK